MIVGVYYFQVHGGPRMEPIRQCVKHFSLPVVLRNFDTRKFMRLRDDVWAGRTSDEVANEQLGLSDLKTFPHSVPFAVLSSGECLFESTVILWYLGAMAKVNPSEIHPQSKALQFLMQAEELQARYQQCRIWGYAPGTDLIDRNGVLDRVEKQYERFLLNLEAELATGTVYLVGNSLTVADLKVASLMEWMDLVSLVFTVKTDHLPYVTKWMARMAVLIKDVRTPMQRGAKIPASQLFCSAVSLRRSDYLQIIDVHRFWFGVNFEERRNFWFRSGPEVNEEIRTKFQSLYEDARAGKLEHWRYTLRGCVALVLLLDQFPRHMFRGTPQMFSTDDMALAVARQCFEYGPKPYEWECAHRFELLFIGLVYEHQESLECSQMAVTYFTKVTHDRTYPESESDLWKHAILMAENDLDMIQKYGRLPYRNSVLGRSSTPAEQAFLDQKISLGSPSPSGLM
mmetsp:Transcript_11928/g.33604  ORF Transcript_11928/g.33604 Transcript_11928/m.33604 type:complete len:455 (-) Transcript_11928:255-1619(-)